MQRLSTNRPSQRAQRHGFTLTEMLVSTGLVLLIMSFFAQIYTTALGTISEQRGLANNDQKARTVSEVLRNDLDLMSYRQIPGTSRGIEPLYPGRVPDPLQSGYFYYSENDPNNNTDDVLQFTMRFPEGANNIWSDEGDDAAFFGKATELGQTNNRAPYFSNSSNQPKFDGPYGSGRSSAAEVSYFLRNGSLHRRVLLIREPAAFVTDNDVQPEYTNLVKVFNTGSTNYGNGIFWRDFDYAVTRVGGVLTFHGLSSLDNINTTGPNPNIAQPWNRFGHHNSGGSHVGFPREYEIHNSNNADFIGRLTLAESSSEDDRSGTPNNGWPSIVTDIFDRSTTDVALNPDTGVITGFEGGTRIGEDILLTNVESFDVKVYDPRENTNVGEFVDVSDASDSYSNNWNTAYGPRDHTGIRLNNIFDTWHRTPPSSVTSPNPIHRPPHAAWDIVPNSWPPAAPQIWEQRDSSNPYTSADDGKVIFHYFDNNDMNPFIGYRLTVTGDGITGVTEPDWKTFAPGTAVTDFDSTLPSTGVTWTPFDNVKGLEAISITVRFRDVQSTQPRQVTIVHSFVD